MISRCAWCSKIMGEKEPLEDKSYTDGICESCSQKLLEQAPDVADGEESAGAVFFKCGCIWGGGSRTKEAHYVKLCWKHGG